MLGLCVLALLLHAGTPRAQQPDPASYGTQVEAGNVVQVRAWLDGGLDPNFLADRIGTGLMIAAWQGDIAMMELLVARGADVNRTNALDESALMHAAWRGQADAIRWLLGRGARINSAPMHWSALHYAAFAGHGGVTTLLLDRGADINARSTNGSSVLMMAVYEGHETLVRQLIARGADRGVKNDRGDGALEWAFKFQRLAIARLVATPQEFVAAANLPKSQWGEPVRSQPVPGNSPDSPPPEPVNPATAQIDDLMSIRNVLASRGMADAAGRLDQRIAALRAQRARANRDTTPAAVFEISASRASPDEQRTRLIFGTDGSPP
jgi:ankyrin repeat protein